MTDVTTLQDVELGVLGPLQVRQHGVSVMIPGAKPRALLTMLGLHAGSVVTADALVELLWDSRPPRTAAKALQTHISLLRRNLGDGFVLTEGAGWSLAGTEVDAASYKAAARRGRDATAAGDTGQAVARFDEALTLWRGLPELPDTQRGAAEKTRWIEGHAALVEDRADALLASGRAAEVIGDLEAAVADAPLRERRWGQLMLALYRAGRQGEALGAYQRARSLLAEELGVDPGPQLRQLEAAIVAQDASLDMPVAQHLSPVTRPVTFLLTDIEGSTAAWEADASAMAVALARHDELVEQVVTSRGGRLIKTRGEGDATFSVFERPSAAAAAAIELQDAIGHEPWALSEPMRVRIALHTGEVELRDGDYFGRAVNRAARLRSLATGGQILCSGAVAELVIDSLSDDVVLADLGVRRLRNLARPEHVFELRIDTGQRVESGADAPLNRPSLPAVLIGSGPFVGRGPELQRLLSAWQTGRAHAVLVAGEPGVGKTRLAGEWSRQAHEQGAIVLYGRCDEDLGAPYQPFAEAIRSLVPCVGADRLRGQRGVEALLPLVPGLLDFVPELTTPARADPDTERYALFDAVVALLESASGAAPVVLILDDLHWAAKPTLLLLRHVLRFADRARLQIVGTYRSTDLDRAHPLAAMLADLHRDGTANRLNLSGLDEDDVTAYVAEAGYDDEQLAHALASVTGGNPFFLIEALRHVDESGGAWDQNTLPQGVREAVSRRLSRLSTEANKALSAAAVVGSTFGLELVEEVIGTDLIDAFDEACQAGLVVEESGGRYRFNHAIVRQSLLTELASVRRLRLHQRIAAALETRPGAEDDLLAELAYHYFECAWAGNASKAVQYCQRAADQAMARLAYEGAADLYDHALHALAEIDDELADRDDQTAMLLVARCEALLAAGDVGSAAGAVSQLQAATVGSARLAAWATCFDGQLSMLVHPERLDEVVAALGAAAEQLATLGDAAGEANAHTVRASCLARLGRIADCEIALDNALTAARHAREHRRVNAVLAGAPLAALWGPNPVPRAGGRCLDVVRLLRITTDSPAVEATSTRCQAVLEALRGRSAAARRMIESARRSVTELGLRHALLEVEQFAGIVELIANDLAAAEPHLRLAYSGFRRMGLDADTAETAALLGRTCLALGRYQEASELCTESERLAGHALKPSIAWRTLRAQLFASSGDHDEARHLAQAAVRLAERTDLLVDHGDACHSLAMVLEASGDITAARSAAERAIGLYELKGAAALIESARRFAGQQVPLSAPSPEAANDEQDNACVRTIRRGWAVVAREAWDEFEDLYATTATMESRRRMVGFARNDLSDNWLSQSRRLHEAGELRLESLVVLGVRGERLALTQMTLGTVDASPGAPRDEFLILFGSDEDGRIALQVAFDLDDIEAAYAELEAADSQLSRLHTAATRVCQRINSYFLSGDWTAVASTLADNVIQDDRRRVVGSGLRRGRDAVMTEISTAASAGIKSMTTETVAIRGGRLVLNRVRSSFGDDRPDAFGIDVLGVVEIDADERIVARVVFDLADFDAAVAELDARYLAGEATAHADTWSVISRGLAAVNRGQPPATMTDCVNVDHRRGAPFAPGDLNAYLRAVLDQDREVRVYVEAVHRLNDRGVVCTDVAQSISPQGFNAEWRSIDLQIVDGDKVSRLELFDEADLDRALAAFERLTRPVSRLVNAATAVHQRLQSHFAAGDWKAMTDTLSDDIVHDDRRPVVGVGRRQGRDAVAAEISAVTEIGMSEMVSDVIAIRGEYLALSRVRSFGGNQRPDAFHADVLDVVEVNAEGQIVARIVFEPDAFDAAFEELDARYIAREAAPYATTCRAIAGTYAAICHREIPSFTTDLISIDHRRVATIASGEIISYLRAGWDIDQEVKVYVAVVHRLNELGAVVTYTAFGSSQEGFEAEWREVAISTVRGEKVNRCEIFEETDLEAALARFDKLSRAVRRLENAAARATQSVLAHFAAGDWHAMAAMMTDNFSNDDRRRVVGAGVQHGRDAEIADMQAVAELWTNVTSSVVAIRGERLVLLRLGMSDLDQGDDAFVTEVLGIVEVTADTMIDGVVVLAADDVDAAFAELDARYLGGEAAPHAHAWSVISGVYAACNHRELPATDWISIDHRRGTPFDSGDLTATIRSSLNFTPDLRIRIEAVHRLDSHGAVVTNSSSGTSNEGFDAEWRMVQLLIVEGDRISRLELFDDSDLDGALARFDELRPAVPRLKNQLSERLLAHFAARDWDALAQDFAEDYYCDDRRRTVNAGIRDGREAAVEDLRISANIGLLTDAAVDVIAIRGERLLLTHWRGSGPDPDAVQFNVVQVVEYYDQQATAAVLFDAEEIDAAFAELDARYLAGQAAPHAHTWKVIADVYAKLDRREAPAVAGDCLEIDHRSLSMIGPGDLRSYVLATFEQLTDTRIYIEAVHKLTDVGAIISHVAKGTSNDGFDAEWRMKVLLTVDGELINRCEIFDESDLDAAMNRFEELQQPPSRLENTATKVNSRFAALYAARDWDAVGRLFADQLVMDDRRRVVGAGPRIGRNAGIDDMRATADLGRTTVTWSAVAIRGQHLMLGRVRYAGRDQREEAFYTDVLNVAEINDEQRIIAIVTFDVDDIDAALEELDARYIAGEAGANAHTWSVIARAAVSFNRHEIPATKPNWVNIDHRHAIAFAPGDLDSYMAATWEVMPDVKCCVDAVHRLSNQGALFTQEVLGSSQESFAAQWRDVVVMMVEGDLLSRCEVFDESDFDAALARFDELHSPTTFLANLASRAYEQYWSYFTRRNWDAMAATLADDYRADDRRRVVNAGLRQGRDGEVANMRIIAEAMNDIETVASTPVATRGDRLALSKVRFPEFQFEVLMVAEINADGRIASTVGFDIDDINAAFEELDSCYVAGEAAAHARTWSLVANRYAALNRHELSPATTDSIDVNDHRRIAMIEPGDPFTLLNTAWELTPNFSIQVEAVLRLDATGAVVRRRTNASSRDGFAAEWRTIDLWTVEGESVSSYEIFDEDDQDAALARFDALISRTSDTG